MKRRTMQVFDMQGSESQQGRKQTSWKNKIMQTGPVIDKIKTTTTFSFYASALLLLPPLCSPHSKTSSLNTVFNTVNQLTSIVG